MNFNKQKQKIARICNKYGIDLLLLFGSQAKERTTNESDFDVAYSSEKPLSLARESRLIIELGPLLKTEQVDLVNLKRTPPLLRYAIFKDCKVLYEKKPLSFACFRAYSFKTYIETKPLYEEKFKRLHKAVKAFDS